MKTFVEFFNGKKMPIVGLGTWQAENREEVEQALNAAFDAGYRHFDTAYMYLNEEVIGDVIKTWLTSGKVKREELFITTKLPTIGMDESRVEHFLKKSLTALKLEYVDLYLMHHPIGLQYTDDQNIYPFENGKLSLDLTTDHGKIWRAMEKQVEAGRAKAIGISNFNSAQIEDIVKNGHILPANLQVEGHVYCQQKELRDTCKKHGITICAYAPLGSPGRKANYKTTNTSSDLPPLQENPVVCAIAKKHGKTPSQILLKFLVQNDVVVIPKSTNAQRLGQNLNLFDFTLSGEELRELEELDQGAAGRTFTAAAYPGAELHPLCPF